MGDYIQLWWTAEHWVEGAYWRVGPLGSLSTPCPQGSWDQELIQSGAVSLASRKRPGRTVYAQMHNEKEQEMTSPVSHSEDAQSTMQGRSRGMGTLLLPPPRGSSEPKGHRWASPARECLWPMSSATIRREPRANRVK